MSKSKFYLALLLVWIVLTVLSLSEVIACWVQQDALLGGAVLRLGGALILTALMAIVWKLAKRVEAHGRAGKPRNDREPEVS